LGVVAPNQMQRAANLKLRRSISDSLLIHQQGEGDASLFPEETGVRKIAQAYGGKLSPRISEIAFMLAQLRDVLPAENSAVMTKKNKDSRTPLPKRAELYLESARVR
jgi:hypothetical protein